MTRKRIINYLNKRFSPKYGSFRGYLRTIVHRLFYYLGRYRKCEAIEWDKVERLVFVCTGNICRSAFAEVVARTLNLEAISCGIDTDDRMPANDMAIHIADKKGFNLGNHKTTKIDSLELRKGDLLIAMEPYQVKYIESLLGDEYAYTLMGLWGAPVMPYIHDPYDASKPYFNNCFEYIEKSVYVTEQKIRQHTN